MFYQGVGHCAWAIYYVTRPFCCASHIAAGRKDVSTKMNTGDFLAKENIPTPAANNSPQGSQVGDHGAYDNRVL